MKPLHFTFFCLLMIAFYFFSQTIFPPASSSSLNSLTARRTMRQRRILLLNHKDRYLKTKGSEETKQRTSQQDSMASKYQIGSDNLDEFIFHIDYHGATTHPTPTPKHPKP